MEITDKVAEYNNDELDRLFKRQGSYIYRFDVQLCTEPMLMQIIIIIVR